MLIARFTPGTAAISIDMASMSALGQTHSTSASTTEGLNRGETLAILLLVNAVAWFLVAAGWL